MLSSDETREYYGAMARAYDENAGYHDPEGEKLRQPAKVHDRRFFKGLKVLEIACGSGYWTEVIAESAASVLATDINASMLELARRRCRLMPNVSFLQTDAYSLDNVSGDFDAAYANNWWSHMPRHLIAKFLTALHSKLKPGSVVLFRDQLPSTSGFSAKNTSAVKTVEGNRLELRLASDGKTYQVIKNYPTMNELQVIVSGVARNVSYREAQGAWSLKYNLNPGRPHVLRSTRRRG